MKKIFGIVLFLILVFQTNILLGQNAHQGELYLDNGCVSKDCLKGMANKYVGGENIGIQGALDKLKDAGVIMNIVVLSEDCGVEGVQQGGVNTVIGPEFLGNCNWYYGSEVGNSQVDYTLIMMPGVFQLHISDKEKDFNLSKEAGWANDFRNLLENYKKENFDFYQSYSRLHVCIIEGVIKKILSLHSNDINIGFIPDWCSQVDTQPFPLVWLKRIPIVHEFNTDAISSILLNEEGYEFKVINNYCTPIVFNVRDCVSEDINEAMYEPVYRRWAELNQVEEYLLIEIQRACSTQVEVESARVSKMYNSSAAGSGIAAVFNNCNNQVSNFSEQDLKDIENAFEGDGALSPSLKGCINNGFAKLQNYLHVDGNKPSLVYCPDCNTDQQITWDFCVPIDEVCAKFLADLDSSNVEFTGVKDLNSTQLLDFGGLPAEQKTQLLDAVNTTEQIYQYNNTSSPKVKFIFSTNKPAGSPTMSSLNINPGYTIITASLPSFLPTPTPAGSIDPDPTDEAIQYYNNQMNNNGFPDDDFVLFMNYDHQKKEICFKIEYSAQIATKLGADGIIMHQEAVKNLVVNDFSVPVDPNLSGIHVDKVDLWKMGIREGLDPSWWRMFCEIGGITKSVLFDGEMPKEVYMPTDQGGTSIFILPPFLAGVGTGLAEAGNAVLQGLGFAYSLTTDQETQQGMLKLLGNPFLLFGMIYQQYAETFDANPSKREHARGRVITETIIGIVSGGTLLNLLKKSADESSDQIRNALDDKFPESKRTAKDVKDNNIPLDTNVGEYPVDYTKGYVPSYDLYHERMNQLFDNDQAFKDFESNFLTTLEPDVMRKVTHHPALVDIWKKVDAGNIPGFPNFGIDEFKEALKQLPDVGNNSFKFYDHLKDMLDLRKAPTGTVPIDAIKFLEDVKIGGKDAFSNKFVNNIDLFETWNMVKEANNPNVKALRRNGEILEELSNDIKNNPNLEDLIKGTDSNIDAGVSTWHFAREANPQISPFLPCNN